MNTQTTTGSRISLPACGLFLDAAIIGFAQPAITTQPQDQTNYVVTTTTFTVVATGTEPVSYQWQKFSAGFADLANRTNAKMVLANVQINDAADEFVVGNAWRRGRSGLGVVVFIAAHLMAIGSHR